MEESTTYQAIIRKGKTQGAREVLLHLGWKHLGAPPATLEAAINSITDFSQLEQLIERVLHVKSWDELIPTV